ncbi:MAG: hypothetical protein Q9187_002604 [Circinaria calcarea]
MPEVPRNRKDLLQALRGPEQLYMLANYIPKEHQFVDMWLRTYQNLGCFRLSGMNQVIPAQRAGSIRRRTCQMHEYKYRTLESRDYDKQASAIDARSSHPEGAKEDTLPAALPDALPTHKELLFQCTRKRALTLREAGDEAERQPTRTRSIAAVTSGGASCGEGSKEREEGEQRAIARLMAKKKQAKAIVNEKKQRARKKTGESQLYEIEFD